MGILNVTPDSFSDGGQFASAEAAVARALEMIAEGAAIIDVGGESTRPGSQPVEAAEQIARTIPVIKGIRVYHDQVTISIDTRSAQVARAALEAGADIINDVSALRDDAEMAGVVARTGAAVVLMHRRGTSAEMQKDGGPHYDDVIAEIRAFLAERVAFAQARGVVASRIIIDPGIGFGKRTEHNLAILRDLREFTTLGPPVLIGASRKRFLGEVTGIDDPRQRDVASLACAVMAAQRGVSIIRTHEVRAAVEALRVVYAVGSLPV